MRFKIASVNTGERLALETWDSRALVTTRLLSISTLLCDAPISRRSVCFPRHTLPPLGSVNSEGFPSSRGRILLRENPRSLRLEIHFLWTLSLDSAAQVKNFFVFGCGLWYDRVRDRATPPTTRTMRISPERDYEGDYEETLPKGRKEADGCKPRHGRDNEKGELSCSGLRATFSY